MLSSSELVDIARYILAAIISYHVVACNLRCIKNCRSCNQLCIGVPVPVPQITELIKQIELSAVVIMVHPIQLIASSGLRPRICTTVGQQVNLLQYYNTTM